MNPSDDAARRALARTALACLDLTRLGPPPAGPGADPPPGADTPDDIDALCRQAVGPAGRGTVAAVCVWPAFVAQARAALPPGIAVAAVANFPHGGLDVQRALGEAQAVLDAGGQEVDLVLPWRALREGQDADAARLVAQVRRATEGHVLKLILESGELARPELIARAARLGLDTGVDFLKTSTGKTAIGATPEAARVMLEAIANHPRGGEVGFKASGGVRSLADAGTYLALVHDHLGPQAGQPRRFRLGASALLAELEAVLSGPEGDGPVGSAEAASSGTQSGTPPGSPPTY